MVCEIKPGKAAHYTIAKHAQPENCPDFNVTRVNPEIWSSLNPYKRKADLRMANLQQSLQKATFATLSTTDTILAMTPTDKTPPVSPILKRLKSTF